MNYPKAYLLFEGKAFVEKIVDAYQAAGFEEISLVINSVFVNGEWHKRFLALPESIHVIQNNFPEKGRLFSVQNGLKTIMSMDYSFIHNVDNPFILPGLINELWANRHETGYAVPSFEGHGGHPVLVSAPIIKAILSSGSCGETLKDVLNRFFRVRVSVNDKNILLNINTREDYLAMCIDRELEINSPDSLNQTRAVGL
jgi:CTP:molybdopterin cytidylyltransferase MocA